MDRAETGDHGVGAHADNDALREKFLQDSQRFFIIGVAEYRC
jgi:hypothetical protein